MIGHTLGHYRVLGEIGAGGMGVVYRAHDEQLDRDIALKVLPSGTLEDQTVRKRFRQEALALAKLNHPNIATIFEFNSQNEIDFLAMELVEGTSLKEGFLPDAETVRLGMQFAQGLAAAWKTLGYDAKAADEAKTAFERSEGLGREDQLTIEGRYREETKDWTKAADVYRRLWQFAPDNLEYGLRLAAVQDRSGKYTDALDTLRQLRQLPAPLSDDPRIDLEETNADTNLSRWEEGLETSEHAIAKARASGARLLLANAFNRQGVFYRYLGKFDQADAAFKEAQDIYSAAGYQLGAAGAMLGLGNSAYHRGDLKAAEGLYEQALETFRKVGSERDAATAQANVATALYEEGDLRRAKEMYESALLVERKIGDRQDAANTMNSIANVLSDEGNHVEAKKAYREVLTAFRELGDKFNEAITLGNLATLLADEGSLREAKPMFEQALEIKRNLNNKHSEAYTESNLGDLLLMEGDLAGARKLQEEALAIRTQLGEKSTAIENRFSLAAISLEEGKPAEALPAAHQVADDFHADHRQDKEATAYGLPDASLPWA
jgi:tetratricopeptide (TPR) repeat protein